MFIVCIVLAKSEQIKRTFTSSQLMLLLTLSKNILFAYPPWGTFNIILFTFVAFVASICLWKYIWTCSVWCIHLYMFVLFFLTKYLYQEGNQKFNIMNILSGTRCKPSTVPGGLYPLNISLKVKSSIGIASPFRTLLTSSAFRFYPDIFLKRLHSLVLKEVRGVRNHFCFCF